MKKLPSKVEKRLDLRKHQNSFRNLGSKNAAIDFSSNDYLGFSGSLDIFEKAQQILQTKNLLKNGSGGSRLLSGNHALYEAAEEQIAQFHCAEAALIFNSGYDANLGFFGNVPQRGDLVLYDELIHASIRDGLNLSNAKKYKFLHNDLEDLQKKIGHFNNKPDGDIYVVTESVFSMDGDEPDLKELVKLSEELDFFLVIDEAHSFGVIGRDGKGKIEELQLQQKIFARIVTFGKALGAHGAAILGSTDVKDYLVNFARSFIFTTALPPHALATIMASYNHFKDKGRHDIEQLHKIIEIFILAVKEAGLDQSFVSSRSAIQCCIIPGNERVKNLAFQLQKKGFDVKPILSPTVPEGKERLRFCLHSYNTSEEITGALSLLQNELMKHE